MSIMTHIEKRKDDDLLLQKGGRAFPYIVFMDEQGGVIAEHDGERTVDGFRKTMAGKVQRFLDLRAKAQSGDAAAQVEFAILEGDLGRITFPELQKRLEGRKLTDAQKEAVSAVEAGAVLAEVLKSDARDEQAFLAVAKKIADAHARGLKPSGAERQQQFFGILLKYALLEKDADLARKALDLMKPALQEMYGDDPKLTAWLRTQEDAIADLKPGKKEGGGGDEGIEEGCGEAPEGGK